jgi:hypothetical protein
MSELVHVVDSAALSHALKAVRDGSSDWVLARHAEKKVDTIELVGHGLGGIEELNNHLKETDISFGLVRVVDRIDLSDTVKFVLIHYLGPSVGALFKVNIKNILIENIKKKKQYKKYLHLKMLGPCWGQYGFAAQVVRALSCCL